MLGIRYRSKDHIERLGLVHSVITTRLHHIEDDDHNVGSNDVYKVYPLEHCAPELSLINHPDRHGNTLKALRVDYRALVTVDEKAIASNIKVYKWNHIHEVVTTFVNSTIYFLHSKLTSKRMITMGVTVSIKGPKLAFECCLYHYDIPVELRAIMTQQYRMSIPLNNTTLRAAVTLWKDDCVACCSVYGHISTWDTTDVTDMNRLLGDDKENKTFNDDISMWDVSNVTNMRYAFCYTKAFNQSLNDWNVAKVTNMSCMFHHATAYNQPMDKWNISHVVNMEHMFSYATSFNQPLHMWNIGKVKSMDHMFRGATQFNQSLNEWNIEHVESAVYMFDGANKIKKHDLNKSWQSLLSFQQIDL